MQAAGDYVRVIVRRPHAYWFIDELFEDRGGIQLGTPAGCTLADGTTAPLPGVYLLDATGGHINSVGLASPGALENLLKLLGGS